MTHREQFNAIIDAACAQFVERDTVVRHLVAAMLGGHHLCMVGPPGEGKSMLIDWLTQCIGGAVVFSSEMHRFQTPKDIFGPVRASLVPQDVYERKTAGYIGDAHFAFLDEIGRSSESVRDTLLKLINERRWRNGDNEVSAPLMSLFSGSNSLLSNEADQAFVDRILVWTPVDDLSMGGLATLLKRDTAVRFPSAPMVTLSDLCAAQREVAAVDATTDQFVGAWLQVVEELRRSGVRVSTRTNMQVRKALKAYAWLDGDAELTSDHIEWATDMLWKTPEQRRVVSRVLADQGNPLLAEAQEAFDRAHVHYAEIQKLPKSAPQDTQLATGRAANLAVREACTKLTRLVDGQPERKVRKVKELLGRLEGYRSELTDRTRNLTGLGPVSDRL